MMQGVRVYRHSTASLVFVLAIMGGFALVILLLGDPKIYFLIAVILFFLAYLYYTLSKKILISDSEISTQDLFGTKTLRWADIANISNRGSSLRLSNSTEDTKLTLDAQLSGYPEIVDILGERRPDLFSGSEFNTFTRSWANSVYMIAFGLIVIGFGAFGISNQQADWFYVLISMAVGVVLIASIALAPQSVSIDGSTLTVRYFFREQTYASTDISSIRLGYQSTRSGKSYFVAITPSNGRPIRVSGMKQGAPILYQVLKQWQAKNSLGQISV